MKPPTLLFLAATYFLLKACQGARQTRRTPIPEPQQRWLADVRAMQALEARGWFPIDQHEKIIGGPMGPEWRN